MAEQVTFLEFWEDRRGAVPEGSRQSIQRLVDAYKKSPQDSYLRTALDRIVRENEPRQAVAQIARGARTVEASMEASAKLGGNRQATGWEGMGDAFGAWYDREYAREAPRVTYQDEFGTFTVPETVTARPGGTYPEFSPERREYAASLRDAALRREGARTYSMAPVLEGDTVVEDQFFAEAPPLGEGPGGDLMGTLSFDQAPSQRPYGVSVEEWEAMPPFQRQRLAPGRPATMDPEQWALLSPEQQAAYLQARERAARGLAAQRVREGRTMGLDSVDPEAISTQTNAELFGRLPGGVPWAPGSPQMGSTAPPKFLQRPPGTAEVAATETVSTPAGTETATVVESGPDLDALAQDPSLGDGTNATWMLGGEGGSADITDPSGTAGDAGGMTGKSLGASIIGGVGIAAAIGNSIADFRTTRDLERQLESSARGRTLARMEGNLAASQAQRNIMATSRGRRDISPALALRNAQMAGSRALSDIYGMAAIESARERRESEAALSDLRKRRWNTLLGGLTQTAGTVGSMLATEGAKTEVANKKAGSR